MVVFEWSHDGIEQLLSRDGAIESARERAAKKHERVVLRRYRPMRESDLDVSQLAQNAWSWLVDHLHYHEVYSHEDGGPEVDDKLPAESVEKLGEVLRELCLKHVDLSQASWVDTGEELIVTPSGEVLGQLALPIDGGAS